MKFLPVVAEEVLIQNIITKYGRQLIKCSFLVVM